MRSEFKREERYIVFKLSKLHTDELVRQKQLNALNNAFIGDARVDCVVIESDWPEYEPAWAMIEARMIGSAPQPPALGGEPEVLGYSVKGNKYAIRLTKGELLELYEGYTGDALVELIDRAHVAPLLAEIEQLNASEAKNIESADRHHNNWVEACKERDTLKADLTSANADKEAYAQNAIDLRKQVDTLKTRNIEARKFLRQAAGMVNGATGSWHQTVADFLCVSDKLNQAAPAAKDGV
jgi:hypothetical protein